jgi:hypothetical protein
MHASSSRSDCYSWSFHQVEGALAVNVRVSMKQMHALSLLSAYCSALASEIIHAQLLRQSLLTLT